MVRISLKYGHGGSRSRGRKSSQKLFVAPAFSEGPKQAVETPGLTFAKMYKHVSASTLF